MYFLSGDRELYGSDNICWHECGKGVFFFQSLLSEIWLCASILYENMMYLMCKGVEGEDVGGKGLLVDGLVH